MPLISISFIDVYGLLPNRKIQILEKMTYHRLLKCFNSKGAFTLARFCARFRTKLAHLVKKINNSLLAKCASLMRNRV